MQNKKEWKLYKVKKINIYRESTVKGLKLETGTQINDLEQKEEINIQPEQSEETRIQKNEERPRYLQDNFKCSNIQITRVPGGKEGE